MKTKFTLLAFINLIVLSVIAHAQTGITVTSSVAKGNQGSISYTVGQYGYVKSRGIGGTVYSGVLIPVEILIVSGFEHQNVNLNIESYPNPVNDFLNLKIHDFRSSHFSYQMFDIIGNLIDEKALYDNLTRINMSGLLPAIYFLNVTAEHKIIKTFKIIKNQ